MPCRHLLLGIALSACAMPAQAQMTAPVFSTKDELAPAKDPIATLRLFGNTRDVTTWLGRGPRIYRTNLCIGSTTGRYRLIVQRDSTSSLDLSISFSDATGQRQHSGSSSDFVEFFGIDAGLGDCSTGPNAWVEFSISEAALLASSAGEYIDGISFAAEPL